MTTQEVKRKLTAILSADVKGYSRLMGEDEKGTVRTLNAYKEVMAGLIQNYHGRVVDAPGDNVLAEFASVVDAVECAVEIQKELKTRNAELPETRRMEFRIGINLGDVIVDGESIYGDGVNIAARLESLAEAGGICISGTAYDHVENKLSLGYQYLGEHAVKNIAKPVRVYRVLMEPEAAGKVIGGKKVKPRQWKNAAMVLVVVLIVVIAAAIIWKFYSPAAPKMEVASKEKMAFPLPNKPSIAVLAFTNMSGDPKDDLFGDGLAEGIINGLSKCEHIFVIARNSTFTYKGKSVKVKQVAEEMGVRYIMEGSLQREGTRVRITAQLIDALTGQHLFSERYDRDLKEILNLQDEITIKVLTAVQVKLTAGEYARWLEKGTRNLEAYLKVMQARESLAVMNKEKQALARSLAEEAIALDPRYPAPYAVLCELTFYESGLGVYKDVRGGLERAAEWGEKAVALDDSSSYAHAVLAFPYGWLKEYDKAISEAEKGVSLDPNSAYAYLALGSALFCAERLQEAVTFLQKSLRLSPIPLTSNVLIVMGHSYRLLDQHEQARATYMRVLQLYGPDHLIAHVSLAGTYALMGREKEARAEGAEVLRIDPNFSLERYGKMFPLKNQALKDKTLEAYRRAGLK